MNRNFKEKSIVFFKFTIFVSAVIVLFILFLVPKDSLAESKENEPQTIKKKVAVKKPLAVQKFSVAAPGENYGLLDVRRDFDTLESWGTLWPFNRVTVVEREEKNNKALRVKYPKGKLRSRDSGASWFWKDFGKHQDLYLSYWVKFQDGFDFRAGGKMHGLTGGKANTGGNKPGGHDGWSSRMHWGKNGIIKQYIYHKDQAGQYGDVIFWEHNPKPFYIGIDRPVEPPHQRAVFAEPGKWHFIEMRVVVNDIGEKNGCVQSWFDGELVLEVYGLEFRDTQCTENQLLVDAMYFSTFFGGNDDRYRPVKDEFAFFDDFMVTEDLFSPEGMVLEPVSERVFLKSVEPKIFDENEENSGYGMHITWNTLPNFKPAFFEIQAAAEHQYALNKWQTLEKKLPASQGNWINHHGDLKYKNYAQNLKSGAKYFYRVRGLDATGRPVTGWSNIGSGLVEPYNSIRLESADSKLFDGEISPGGGKYGYGTQIKWQAVSNPEKVFYEIQYTTDSNLSENSWKVYMNRLSAKDRQSVNHIGDGIYKNYQKCLPSNTRLYYRIRTLDKDGNPLDEWSNIQSAKIPNYRYKRLSLE